MSRVLFISESYVKDNTVLDENVDAKLLRNVIEDVQRIKFEQYLGTDLYNDFKTEIAADPDLSGNALYKTLLQEYIQPCLKHWVVFECCDYLVFKFRNKGVVKQNSENSQSLLLDEVQYLKDQSRIKAEFLAKRLVEYLCDNEDTYPKYNDNGDSSDLQPTKNTYFSGIYLGLNEEPKDLQSFYRDDTTEIL
jgi:hypothetical protein